MTATLCRSHRFGATKAEIGSNGRWKDKITWDELQRIKSEIGRGEQWAVELFPADSQVVNVANMRHLWLLTKPPEFRWKTP